MDVQNIYNVKYLPSDFKKNKGYERSIEICKDYNIFRQCYCGCVFAAMKQGIDFKQINKSKCILQQFNDKIPKVEGNERFSKGYFSTFGIFYSTSFYE